MDKSSDIFVAVLQEVCHPNEQGTDRVRSPLHGAIHERRTLALHADPQRNRVSHRRDFSSATARPAGVAQSMRNSTYSISPIAFRSHVDKRTWKSLSIHDQMTADDFGKVQYNTPDKEHRSRHPPPCSQIRKVSNISSTRRGIPGSIRPAYPSVRHFPKDAIVTRPPGRTVTADRAAGPRADESS